MRLWYHHKILLGQKLVYSVTQYIYIYIYIYVCVCVCVCVCMYVCVFVFVDRYLNQKESASLDGVELFEEVFFV